MLRADYCAPLMEVLTASIREGIKALIYEWWRKKQILLPRRNAPFRKNVLTIEQTPQNRRKRNVIHSATGREAPIGGLSSAGG